jgi:8-oxo-dGTP diphosphatase
MADDYPRIDVTVDVVALTHVDDELHVLVVRRGKPPFEGQWALPGGYLEVDEDLAPASVRELAEETGIELAPDEVRQLGAYGAPDRDPRNRTVSIAHVVVLDEPSQPKGGSDAADARWMAADEVLASGNLAFDHAAILRDATT